MIPDMLATATATRRFGHLIEEHVIVTFADAHQEAGVLTGCGWDTIEVLHTYGADHQWTAVYSLTGDADTPHVVAVTVDGPQTEALFA